MSLYEKFLFCDCDTLVFSLCLCQRVFVSIIQHRCMLVYSHTLMQNKWVQTLRQHNRSTLRYSALTVNFFPLSLSVHQLCHRHSSVCVCVFHISELSFITTSISKSWCERKLLNRDISSHCRGLRQRIHWKWNDYWLLWCSNCMTLVYL